MAECRFYKTGEMVKMATSRTIRGNKTEPVPVTRPWCEHNDSPATEDQARQQPSQKLLLCGGRFDDCPIGYRPE